MSKAVAQQGQAGSSAPSETFTFKLEAKTAGAPMPEGSTGTTKTATVTGAGKVEFGNMRATQEGTYVYEVTEVATNAQGWTYDQHIYTMTATVKRVNGKLAVSQTWKKDGQDFDPKADTLAVTNVHTDEGANPSPSPKPSAGTVTVYKSSSVAATTAIKAGDKVVFTMTAKNTGTATAKYTRVRDYVPAGMTFVSATDGGVLCNASYVEWVLKDIAAGESKAVSFSVTVNEGTSGIVANRALYETTDTDPGEPGTKEDDPKHSTNATENTTDPDKYPVAAIVDVEKTAEPAAGSAVKAGGKIVYTLTFRNSGGTATDSAGARDYIPAGTTYVEGSATDGGTYDAGRNCVDWTGVSVAAGGEKSVSFAVTLDEDSTTTPANQAMFDDNWDGGDDPDGRTNIVENENGGAASGGASLSLEKSGVLADGVITYSLQLRNSGDAATDKAGVRDYVPEHTAYVEGSASDGGAYDANRNCVDWTGLAVEAGSTKTVTFQVAVEDGYTGEVANTAMFEDGWDGGDDPSGRSNALSTDASKGGSANSGTAAGDGSYVNPYGGGNSGTTAGDGSNASGKGTASTGQTALVAGLLALLALMALVFGIAQVRRRSAAAAGASPTRRRC